MLVKIMDGLYIGDKDSEEDAMKKGVTHILRRAFGAGTPPQSHWQIFLL